MYHLPQPACSWGKQVGISHSTTYFKLQRSNVIFLTTSGKCFARSLVTPKFQVQLTGLTEARHAVTKDNKWWGPYREEAGSLQTERFKRGSTNENNNLTMRPPWACLAWRRDGREGIVSMHTDTLRAAVKKMGPDSF